MSSVIRSSYSRENKQFLFIIFYTTYNSKVTCRQIVKNQQQKIIKQTGSAYMIHNFKKVFANYNKNVTDKQAEQK